MNTPNKISGSTISIKEHIKNIFNHMKLNYTEEFINSIIQIKVSLLIFFIIVTCVYLAKQKAFIQNNNVHAYTLLNSKKYFVNLLLSCSIDAIAGMVTFLFILNNRDNTNSIYSIISNKCNDLLIVGAIIFLFKFVREASGFNRWNNQYNNAYQNIISSECNKQINSETLQHPFEHAMSYTTLGLVGSFIALFVIKMLFLSYHGYTDGNLNLISTQQLLLELGFIGFINLLPSLVEPSLFDEKLNSKTFYNASFMAGTAIAFHVMSQCAGLYNGMDSK